MKLENQPYARINIMPLQGAGTELVGLILTSEPGNWQAIIDFRHVTHSIIPIASTADTEAILIVRPRKLTEIDKARLAKENAAAITAGRK